MTRGFQNLRISDYPASPATISNEEFQKTATTETTAQRIPLCTVRSRSRRSQSIHRRRSLAAHGHCSQIAWGNCAVLTVHPASHVALSDHNDATNAAFATATPHSVNFVPGIPFRTDDSPDIRLQRRALLPPISKLLRARSQCLQRPS